MSGKTFYRSTAPYDAMLKTLEDERKKYRDCARSLITGADQYWKLAHPTITLREARRMESLAERYQRAESEIRDAISSIRNASRAVVSVSKALDRQL